MELGKPVYAYGVTAGNMDSMINRYTADRKIRSDDAYSPGNVADKRPDRAAIVYSQRCREAYPDVPIILGGIEGSLRRIAHYDYWSDKVRRSILIDARADVLLYGNAERAIVDVVHGLSKGYTFEQVAEKMGITRITLTQNLGRNPTINTLQRVADAIGCKVGDFFVDDVSEDEGSNTIVCPKCGAKFGLVEKE